MNRWSSTVIFLLVCTSASAGQEEVAANAVRQRLQQLKREAGWGKVVLREGKQQVVRVDTVRGDSVAVGERLGPLYFRPAVYALSDIESVSILREGPRPVAQTRPVVSITQALGLELLVPGAGYLYVGERGTALGLAGAAAAATATALATGTDGAAGWVPLAAWLKVASLLDLRDQVRAMNGTGTDGGADGGGGPVTRPGTYLRNLSLGIAFQPGGSAPQMVARTAF